MAHADLFTRCTHCREEIRIAHGATHYARLVTCHRCGTPAYLWQLLGRANREPAPVLTELHGTWEGARA